MPKSRHKGRGRRFTNFEAEQERLEKEAKQANWRARKGDMDSDEEDDSDKSGTEEESESEEESSSEEDEDQKVRKPKGIQGLIECENPNRAQGKANRKVTEGDIEGKPQLSRREKEELQKQRAIAYHQAGKSEQARADLERLAIIRARREEAEAKRKEQLQAKEGATPKAGGSASAASAAGKAGKKKS